MRVVKPWVSALKIDEGAFADWTAKAPKHESVTFWCLDRGFLRASDYFPWAMEHYGLPLVNSEYFNLPGQRDLWQKIRTVANWSAELLPLEEWDGVILVGCVEPPTDIRWSFPVQYVLAQARDLKAHWERLCGDTTRVMAEEAPTLDMENEPTSPGLAPATAATQPLVKEIKAPPPPPIPQLDGPDGLKISFPAGTKAPPTDSAPPLPPPRSSVNESPEGLNINFIGKKALKLDPKAPDGLALPTPNAGHDQQEEPTRDIPPAMIAELKKTPGSGFTLVSNPDLKANAANGVVDSDQLAPATMEAATSETQAVAWVFQQLKQNFRYSWLLAVQGDMVRVWRWDSACKPASDEALAPIDVGQPSLFRIVSRTRMPYHGHVVESQINTIFFRNWGLRQTPAHVTAVPLMSESHLTAILLAAGEKPAQPDQVLRFCEKMAAALIINIGKKAA